MLIEVVLADLLDEFLFWFVVHLVSSVVVPFFVVVAGVGFSIYYIHIIYIHATCLT